MSYALFQSVDFGSGRTGLATVGYRLYTIAGGLGARVTTGVAEITDGKYGAVVTFPDAFRGALVWDSGEVSPVYAQHDINPETGENVDTKVSTGAGTGATAEEVAAAVWAATTRSLTTFGTLVADIVTAVWAAGNRTLTAFGWIEVPSASEVADAVWDEVAADHLVSGTTGELLKKLDVGGATAPVVAVPRTVAPALPATTGGNGTHPTGRPRPMEITFVAKLKWVEKRPNEQMVIRNFEAIRLMCTAILYEQAEKWAEANAAKKEAEMILDDELKDYLAGQQLTIPMATGDDSFGFSDLGGPL